MKLLRFKIESRLYLYDSAGKFDTSVWVRTHTRHCIAASGKRRNEMVWHHPTPIEESREVHKCPPEDVSYGIVGKGSRTISTRDHRVLPSVPGISYRGVYRRKPGSPIYLLPIPQGRGMRNAFPHEKKRKFDTTFWGIMFLINFWINFLSSSLYEGSM